MAEAPDELEKDEFDRDEVETDEELEPTGQAPLARRLGAEFLGTLLLVLVGAGAATTLLLQPIQAFGQISGIFQGQPEGGEVFEAVIGSASANPLPVAFAFAMVLTVLVYAFGGTSGGHFNPAVTAALAVVRRFRLADVLPYWIAQIAGGLAGAFIVAAIYKDVVGGQEVLFGATQISDGVTPWQGLLAEALIGFILMTAIMAVAIDRRAPKGWSGLIIGLALGAGILVTASATDGSANFARSLGPLVASLVWGPDNIPWGDLWIYAAGPILGAAAAALLYESVTGMEPVPPAPRPGSATTPEGEEGLTIEIGERDESMVGTTEPRDSFDRTSTTE